MFRMIIGLTSVTTQFDDVLSSIYAVYHCGKWLLRFSFIQYLWLHLNSHFKKHKNLKSWQPITGSCNLYLHTINIAPWSLRDSTEMSSGGMMIWHTWDNKHEYNFKIEGNQSIYQYKWCPNWIYQGSEKPWSWLYKILSKDPGKTIEETIIRGHFPNCQEDISFLLRYVW